MRRLIAIALSLLCIALPLRSGADVALDNKHCPHMQAHLQAAAQDHAPADAHTDMNGMASHAGSSGGHDCCNDAATFAKTGQLCKMGQECSPPVTYLLPPTLLQAAIATQHTVLTTLSIPLHTRPPGAVWRPPNLS